MGFNPFDPAGILGGGGGGGLDSLFGGGSSSGGSGVGLSIAPGQNPNQNDQEQPLDAQKAYGFGANDSLFNRQRKAMMGAGGPPQGQ